jgi:hypothetical protein
MVFHAEFFVRTLPLWFLVFSLFLPRVALFLMWLQGGVLPFRIVGLLPLIVAILLPRALVLYLIYLDQGISLWFVVHLVVALMVWGGSSRYHTRRDRYRDR